MITANRYHDFSMGHRVVGHESACARYHGHNYRITFFCEAADGLDAVGRVMDFSDIKSRLCMWLENNWDHKFLMWEKDPWLEPMTAMLHDVDNLANCNDPGVEDSIVVVPFNPTAENMGQYLIDIVGPKQLEGSTVQLVSVTVEETRKCSASVSIGEITNV